MKTAWPSSRALVAVSSLGVLAALAACTSGVPAQGAGNSDAPAFGSPASENEEGGTRALDASAAVDAPFTCETDGIYGEPRPGVALLEQLRVAAGLDVLEERRVVVATVETDAGVPPGSRAGTPCSGATDQAACATAFAKLSSGGEALRPAFDEIDFIRANDLGLARPPGYYLAYTKGDAVGKVSNRTELRAVFPAIDTPAKALLYANAAGYRVECQRAAGWVRAEADGWVLVASRGHDKRCTRIDVLLLLRRDGTTEEREVIQGQRDSCT